MTITYTKQSMTTGNTVAFKEFSSKKQAITFFNEVCNELGYDNIAADKTTARELLSAGGIGHDYRIELEIR